MPNLLFFDNVILRDFKNVKGEKKNILNLNVDLRND